MSDFATKLGHFIVDFRIKKKDLAIGVGVRPETITNWLLHGKKPNKKNLLALNAFTEGYITEADGD